MVQFDIQIDDHGSAAAFQKKSGEINSQFNNLTKDLVDIAHRWVQHDAPRKTGKLKAAVKKVHTGTQGIIWVNKSVAPYWEFVIDGTRPHKIVAKYKKALRVPGWGIFKSVNHPGTRANPFIDTAMLKMEGDINRRVSLFEDWLGEV